MKAVCALVCLALAHGATANIFKRSQQEDVIVDPQEYINQYQRPLYQPQEQTYRQYSRTYKKPRQHQQQQYQQQQYKQYQQYQQDEQKYQARYQPKQQSQSASSESSQETKENIREYAALSRAAAAAREWSAPRYSAVMKTKLQDDSAESIIPTKIPINSPVQKEIQQIYADAQKAMIHPTEEEKTSFHEAFDIAQKNEDGRLNATELLKKNGYPVEEHIVKTDDGYFLTVFRILTKKQVRDVMSKPVVFLMHGLLGSADDWLLMGPGKSLAYLLADAGYDVWLGNARGNKYARRHVSKHPALNDFWQFGTDEVALHDLPTMIDYALKTSGQDKLHYVGHAQGTTAFFALAASRPEYNNKIISMHALSPMVYMAHVRSPLIRMVAPTSSFESKLHKKIGHGAFEPTKAVIASVGGDMLVDAIGCKEVGSNVNFVMSGVNIENVDAEQAAVVAAHLPAGGSTRTIKQYGQGVASGEFRKYDYGPVVNSQVYGTVEPPKYNMSRVTAPVTLYSAAEDWLAHPADVARLDAALPHSTAYEVPDPHFSHMDFQFSAKAPELVYKKLIDSMNAQAQD